MKTASTTKVSSLTPPTWTPSGRDAWLSDLQAGNTHDKLLTIWQFGHHTRFINSPSLSWTRFFSPGAFVKISKKWQSKWFAKKTKGDKSRKEKENQINTLFILVPPEICHLLQNFSTFSQKGRQALMSEWSPTTTRRSHHRDSHRPSLWGHSCSPHWGLSSGLCHAFKHRELPACSWLFYAPLAQT